MQSFVSWRCPGPDPGLPTPFGPVPCIRRPAVETPEEPVWIQLLKPASLHAVYPPLGRASWEDCRKWPTPQGGAVVGSEWRQRETSQEGHPGPRRPLRAPPAPRPGTYGGEACRGGGQTREERGGISRAVGIHSLAVCEVGGPAQGWGAAGRLVSGGQAVP